MARHSAAPTALHFVTRLAAMPDAQIHSPRTEPGPAGGGDHAAPLHHGGDLAWAVARFGPSNTGWLDLSTGINPQPYPVPPLPAERWAEAWTRLPGTAAVDALRAAAARCYGVRALGAIVAAPGTQALIQLLPRLRPAGRVAVLGPTYAEHAHAWAAAGHAVTEVAASGGEPWGDLGDTADVVVVTNPNNPDGHAVAPVRLIEAAAALAARGGWLVVDEAFADTAPVLSVAAAAGRPGLVVLRSFGKFFGLAGVRLGFALTGPGLAARTAAGLGPWAVSGPAIAVGTAALADRAWIAATRTALNAAAARLDRLLAAHGLGVAGGTSLFRLVEDPAAPEVFERLGRAGILVRHFPGRPDRLRFGLPGSEADWRRLEAAL